MLLHRVDTYGTWNKASVRHEGSFIHLLFTTDNDNRPERVLVIHTDRNRLIAQMHSWRGGEVGENVYGRARVRRPDARSVTVAFRRTLLGSNVTEYGWHVDSQFHQNGHPHCGSNNGIVIVCPDSSPNDSHPYAYLRHQL